ncbi:MAG: cell surface protein SprA [candidate division Zixibacteria bacterium]|nr:cell surface protein SprA [candidate division Zixibacteria bacterium]
MRILSSNRVLSFAGLLLAVALWLPSRAEGQGIGFQSRLDDPAPVVSWYDAVPQDFSAANPPLSMEPLVQLLRRTPKVVEASFDSSRITFNTEYYPGEWMVPVAVDADLFLQYRLAKKVNQGFRNLSQDQLANAEKNRKQREGVSVGIALPKRLNSVFGEGGGNLRVSGYRRISFSGRSQWTDGARADLIGQSRFPSLNMDQIYRFDIEGTIGSKISVFVSEDSQTDIPLSNRIQIRYKGDEDDILKSIEAGNTNLNLPNTRFVGYSSRIQGLFGLKAEAQLGALRLIGIVSQEKGSSERASISASGEENAERIRDYDFAEGRIYDLMEPGFFQASDRIINLAVYEGRPYARPEQALTLSNAKIRTEQDTLATDLFQVLTLVEEIDDNLYQWYDDENNNRHYVVFNSARRDYALGVWMQVERTTGGLLDTITIGDLTRTDTLLLKQLRPATNYNPTHPTWPLMWRNVYQIPKGARADELSLKIFKGAPGTEGTSSAVDYQLVGTTSETYLSILGLDQFDRNEVRRPDDLVDDRLETFRSDWGLLIFPSREPFASDTTFTDANGTSTPALEEKATNFYAYSSPKEKTEDSKYYIEYSSKSRSAVIKLNRANIIEGSERVTANGRLLTRGPDYSIQYDFGTLTLLSPEALDPNSRVTVDFEYAPFLAIQKKSLFGLRGEYQFSDDFRFGSTMLFKTDKAQERKPRVGQETANMTVLDMDGSLKLYPRFITKALDLLPLIRTDAPSTMTISGEVAQSRPNPNVNNIAYIDDFESALEQLNLPMGRGGWTLSSKPAQLAPNYERARMLWHNPVGGRPLQEIYDRDVRQGQGTLNTFRMIWRPRSTPQIADTNFVDTIPAPSFGGIMTYFAGIDPYRVQLFEIRVKGNRGKLHFDFGRISEDINGDGVLDSEDGSVTGLKNQQLEEDEDLGYDGVADAGETGYDAQASPDPSNDNWYSAAGGSGEGKCPLPSCNTAQFDDPNDRRFYDFLNGTEGNIRDIVSLAIPDEEQLSRNNFETVDAYFSYTIDLSDRSDTSFYVVNSTNDSGWSTFRIPIRDSTVIDTAVSTGSNLVADWKYVTHARVWFEADQFKAEWDTVEVAAWYFVQSNWRDSTILRRQRVDTAKFVVASLSEDEGTFIPPPGVEAYEDQASNVTEAQKGLGLVFEDVLVGDTCMAIKKLPSVDRYSGYRSLEMYVHGGDKTNSFPAESVLFFFRLGRDERNYYEYRTLVYPGWDPRNFVNFDFNEVTALKDRLQKALPKGTTADKVDSVVGNYRVKGNPNINEVQFLAAGILNGDSTQPVSGEIWLDELRVTNVRRDVGNAARVEVVGNLADIGSYNIQWGQKNPYFRGISATTRGGSSDNLGSGASENDYQWNVSINLDKFLPRSLNASLPVGYSYSKSTRLPLLRTGSDIVLPEDVRELEKSVATTRSVRASESFNRKGSNPLFKLFLNRQKLNFSYSRNQSQDVTRPFSFGENYNFNGNFDMSWETPPSLKPLGWTGSIPLLKKVKNTRISFYPYQWRWRGTFNRNISISDDANNKRVSSLQRDFDGGMDLSYKLFENLGATYTFTTKNDLTDKDRVKIALNGFRLGLQTYYSQTLTSTYDPKLFSFLGTGLSYTATYSDNYERTTKTRKSDVSRSWSVNGAFRHQELFSITKKGGAGSSSGNRPMTQQERARGYRQEDLKKKRTTTANQAGKKKGIRLIDLPFAGVRFATGWIDPIQYRYTKSYNASLPGMLGRPGWQYRFGFTDDADIETVRESRNPDAREGASYDLSSGFRFMGGISTKVGYKKTVSRDLIRVGDKNERTSTSWPDLDITIGKFKTLPLIKGPVNKVIDIFAPRTGFSRQTTEDFNLSRGFATSKTESRDYNPLVGVNFKLFRSLSLSASYGVTKQEAKRYSQANGEILNHTRSTQKSMTVTSRYSFRAPGGLKLPLFGKMKITSTMNIELNVRRTLNSSESSSAGGPFQNANEKSDMMISPIISYDFSTQIKGGLTAQWQDTKDGTRKSHVRMLQIWAEIRF